MVACMRSPSSPEILAYLRQHPEGATLPEIIRELCPNAGYSERAVLRSRLYERLSRLATYGEVERIVEAEGYGRGRKVRWRAVQ